MSTATATGSGSGSGSGSGYSCDSNVDNVVDVVDEILECAKKALYLQASSLLNGLTSLMDPDNELFCGDKEEKRLRMKLVEHASEIQLIRDRTTKVVNTIALEESVGEVDSEWVYGTKYFGVSTYYKLSDDGCITVRMEGGLDQLPFFEQAAVINDADNFKKWVPFCDESILLEKLSPAELLLYISVTVPMTLTRDTCIHAYGVDCLRDHGKILLLGNSVVHEQGEDKKKEQGVKLNADSARSRSREEEEEIKSGNKMHDKYTLPKSTLVQGDGGVIERVISHTLETACPWKRTGWGTSRMYIKEFTAIIDLTGPESARPVIIACIDPNCGRLVPQWVLNFFIKNLAGVALHVFQKQVQKMAKQSKMTNEERKKKKNNSDKEQEDDDGTLGKKSLQKNRKFYVEWLLPKIREHAKFMEWNIHDINVLGEDGRMTPNRENNDESTT